MADEVMSNPEMWIFSQNQEKQSVLRSVLFVSHTEISPFNAEIADKGRLWMKTNLVVWR